MLTEDELKEIEARAKSIRQQPNYIPNVPMEDGYPCPMCDGEGDLFFSTIESDGDFAAGVQVFGIGDDLKAMTDFTAHAHSDIEKLLAEVRRLQQDTEHFLWLLQDEHQYSRSGEHDPLVCGYCKLLVQYNALKDVVRSQDQQIS